jgi:hypothetical protein
LTDPQPLRGFFHPLEKRTGFRATRLSASNSSFALCCQPPTKLVLDSFIMAKSGASRKSSLSMPGITFRDVLPFYVVHRGKQCR